MKKAHWVNLCIELLLETRRILSLESFPLQKNGDFEKYTPTPNMDAFKYVFDHWQETVDQKDSVVVILIKCSFPSVSKRIEFHSVLTGDVAACFEKLFLHKW